MDVQSRELTGLASSGVDIDTTLQSITSSVSGQNISHNVGTLRVAVHNDLSVGALGVESGNLLDTVGSTLGDLRAPRSTVGNIVLDLNEVAALALLPQLGAGRIDEREGAAVVVGSIVATGHEDDHILAVGGELGSSRGLSDGERR